MANSQFFYSYKEGLQMSLGNPLNELSTMQGFITLRNKVLFTAENNNTF